MAGSAEFVVQSKFRCRSAFAGVAEVQQRCGCRGLAGEVRWCTIYQMKRWLIKTINHMVQSGYYHSPHSLSEMSL